MSSKKEFYMTILIVVVTFAHILLYSASSAAPHEPPLDDKCYSCPCPKLIYSPVCGTDGITYSNYCVLDCVRKKCKPDLRIKHCGECGQPPQESCFGD